MSTPGDGIGAALEAMRSDSRTWNDAADSLTDPVNATADLSVTPADVSMWATDRGIDTTINEARRALEDMLKQGQEYFQQIARNLSDAADQYERDDEQGKHELHQSQ